MPPIDFHCHLDDPVFAERRSAIIAECRAAGFRRLVLAVDPYQESSPDVSREMLAEEDLFRATIGAHPHRANEYSPAVERRITDLLAHPLVFALGECGLDFHYDFSPRDDQERVFRRQIALAVEHGKPLVIHSRKAEELILQILEEEGFSLPVVFHCYTGSPEVAREIVNRGYGISISGIVTFKKAEELRIVATKTPLDRLFTETDSPYLAPEPQRGRTNTPLAIPVIAATLARLRGVPLEEIYTAVEKNLDSLLSR